MNILVIFLQMLPLIVYIIVDSLVSNNVFSIISAIIFAVGQMIITYLKMKQIDWFILLDAGLIILMGAISIVFNNEIFFKIKPVLIEGIFCIYLFVMLFMPDSFLAGYFSRNTGGMAINPAAIPKMKQMLLIVNIYIILHICAVIYTAFYSSKKIWAFTAGPGLYFIFIPVIILIVLRRLFKPVKKDPADDEDKDKNINKTDS